MKDANIFSFLKLFTILTAIPLITGCGPNQRGRSLGTEEETEAQEVVYQADLNDLNGSVKGSQATDGTLEIRMNGDEITIEINAAALPPGIMHLQHLHGFEDGSDAQCPPFEEADNNNDGVVDLIETRDFAGITMIPLHDDPVSLEIKTETYPRANEDGDLRYTSTFSLDALEKAMQEKFGVQSVNFENMVVFIHGVTEAAQVPESAQSLPDVPARITLPVACGVIESQ